jgi:REP element-mobilizing transposase RayT
MTLPRPVTPGRLLFITRRCTQRTFLLRPDDETNNAFTYLLAEAAQRFEIDIILSQMMSNHHHTALYDRHGRYVEFTQHFHRLMAASQNVLRSRWENLWAAEEPCIVEVMTVDDLLDKLVYIATNPVKDGLVDKVHHWPGPKFVHALRTGAPMRAHRPRYYFRTDGPMPAEAELWLKLPDMIENRAEYLAELERRIAASEDEYARERRATGRRVMGRAAVKQQAWRNRPRSPEPHGELRPRVAARNKWLRIMALQRNREWQAEYRHARERWLAGEDVAFPYGTYWLKRFGNVTVQPPPEAN